MYCNKCGQQFPVDSLFCNNCGQDLRNLADESVIKTTDDSTTIEAQKNNRLKKLLSRLSENITSNVLVCIGSLIAFFLSISNIREVYRDIILKFKLINIQKEIVDLTAKIYRSALGEESKLSQYRFELYLDFGKVLLLGAVIIISVLVLIYFLKKLIPMIKERKGVNDHAL